MNKRLFDLVTGSVIAVLLSPLMLACAAMVYLKLGPPVIFRQTRPGLNGKPFQMVKFRTMQNSFDIYGKPLPDSERLNTFGKRLRSTSLDELPELWNVIVGDMSLVGPRPLLMEYLPLYDSEQMRRHEVRPGITGWAQVNGRNALSWQERFRLDVWYVDNQSMLLDCKILWMTVCKVLAREGVTQEGEVTMSKFAGNQRAINSDKT